MLSLSPLHLRVREMGWTVLSLILSEVHWAAASFFKQGRKTCSIWVILISCFTHSHLPPPCNKMKTSISVLDSQDMTQCQWNLFLIWVTNSYLTIQVIFLHIHPSNSSKLTGGDSIKFNSQASPLTPWDCNPAIQFFATLSCAALFIYYLCKIKSLAFESHPLLFLRLFPTASQVRQTIIRTMFIYNG